MRDIFTTEERAVVLFLVTALSVGGLVLSARRVRPEFAAPPEVTTPRGAVDVGERREGPVDLNSADAAELERLPGVGPVRAQAILALRSSRGRFASVDELLDVKGIGPATLEKIRPEARVGSDADSTEGGSP